MSTEIHGLEVVTGIAKTFGLEEYLRSDGSRLWFHISPGGTVRGATRHSLPPYVDVWIEAANGSAYPLLWVHEQVDERMAGWAERTKKATYEQCVATLHKAFEIAAKYEQEKPT